MCVNLKPTRYSISDNKNHHHCMKWFIVLKQMMCIFVGFAIFLQSTKPICCVYTNVNRLCKIQFKLKFSIKKWQHLRNCK